MNFLATTLVSILRGTTENEFGDEIDAANPGNIVQRDIPASIMEQRTPLSPRGRRIVFTPADETPREVRWINARLPAGTNILAGDRLLDQTTGNIYALDTIQKDVSPITEIDLRLEVRQTT